MERFIGMTVPTCWEERIARRLLLGEHKINRRGSVRLHANTFFPGTRFAENWAGDALFSEHIERAFLADNVPALMPGHDLVFPPRHIGKAVFPRFVSYRVVRMRDLQ